MNDYTLDELGKPETYLADDNLATFARKICSETYVSGSMPFGEWKREYLAGKHPQHVFERLTQTIENERIANEAATKALFAKTTKIEDALSKLAAKIPVGITLDVCESNLIIKAPWDGGDLNERLKRLGGAWNREKKHFDVPFDAAPSLARVLTNWRKKQDEQDAAKAEANRKATIKRQQEEAQRVEKKRQRDAFYAEQRKKQEEAVVSRVQVVVGQYKIGDILDGKPITGFGKSWEEATLSAGELYQECDYGRCENEPVCVNCFKCAKHCGCDSKTYCYAYFE